MALLVFAVINTGCYVASKPNSHHRCRWELCPYKGITPKEFKPAVLAYTQDYDGSESVAVDMLHLLHPRWSYEKIARAIDED